jgi:uncharacterized protein (DUF2252 family)
VTKRTEEVPAILAPERLAARQLTLDRERTRRFPELFTRKLKRMSASPLAFLRGAAPLFYEILAARPDLGTGPGGEGWIVGDMHLENFGAYRPEAVGAARESKHRVAHFDLDDFDDASIGPWRLDVLRLTTSLLLGGRELGATGVLALALSDRLLAAWARSAFERAPVPEAPAPVARLIAQVRARPRSALLADRTETKKHGRLRFVRGPRYAELPKRVVDAVPAAFQAYVEALPHEDRPHEGSLEILDCALRIAGTGSLGGLRIGVLVKGKGGPDGGWIFDMKEQEEPSSAALCGPSDLAPGARVCAAFRACVAQPPRMLGSTVLRGAGRSPRSMFVRKLSPQEDRLDLARLEGRDLPDLATYLGALLGAAHRRAATRSPRRWSASDLDVLRAHAVTLAGLHEATYLALCERMRPLLLG